MDYFMLVLSSAASLLVVSSDLNGVVDYLVSLFVLLSY